MLTPQDITEKGFVKAVFGGYDMEGVDEFLEAVSNDYNALYKENAILKGKLKVLVEKVEEYRSTEDAMRMALLTAQRMGEEITVEAKKTKEEMLQSAEAEIKAKLSDTASRVADEEMRLALAAKETAKFIELSQAIIRKHSEFLDKLESARKAVKPKSDLKPAANDAGSSVKPVKPAKHHAPQVKPSQPPHEASPPVQYAPVQQTHMNQMSMQQAPTQPSSQSTPASAKDFEIDDIANQIGSIVEQMTDDSSSLPPLPEKPPATPVHQTVHTAPVMSVIDEPHPSLFENEDGSSRFYTPDDDLENTSPRPKFDFDDLKFGANFDNED